MRLNRKETGMQPTRRVIIGGGAALLASVVLPQVASAAPFYWQHFGAAPYAAKRAEAMRTRAFAFRQLGLSEPLVAAFLQATEQPGRPLTLTNGMRLTAMLSRGGVAHHDVIVSFVKPPVSGKMEYAAPAEFWAVRWRGTLYEVILPEVCNNWSLLIERPEAGCYIIPFDYRQTAGVVWENGAAHLEFHFADMGERELERLNASSCFGVGAGSDFFKPFHRCDVCTTGQWPPPELARLVGLPEREPKGVFAARVVGGVGYVSIPLWAIAYLGIYCVDVVAYAISVQGFEGWQAVSRFNIVTPYEMRRTLPREQLGRTLHGERHY